MIARSLALVALALALPPPAVALGEDDYIGSIELVGFNFCPEGTEYPFGQVLPVKGLDALYSLLANRFGGDAAQKIFALPDLHDKAPLDGMRYCLVIDGTFPPQN